MSTRHEQRKEQLIDRAADAFATRGFHNTTMDELLAATELTKGGLYHYVSSKDELLYLIFERLSVPLIAEVEAIVRGSEQPTVQLRLVAHAWLVHFERHMHHAKVCLQEWPSIEYGPYGDVVRAREVTFWGLVNELFERLQAEGKLRVASPRWALVALEGMVSWATYMRKDQTDISSDQLVEQYCDFLVGTGAPREELRPERPSLWGFTKKRRNEP